MPQVVVAIPTAGFISNLGRAGQEEAIFAAILDPADRIAFFSSETIMSDDPIIPVISSNTNMSVRDLIAPFGASEA